MIESGILKSQREIFIVEVTICAYFSLATFANLGFELVFRNLGLWRQRIMDGTQKEQRIQ
jgi:hypothetical protein